MVLYITEESLKKNYNIYVIQNIYSIIKLDV